MSVVNQDMKIFLINHLVQEGFTLSTSYILVAQAAHETSNFTSKIFRENNNFFGMKLPLVRQTTATGEKYGHATYKNLAESVKDIRLYFEAVKIPAVFKDCNSYVEIIKKKRYFEADQEAYKKGVNYFYNLYFNG